MTTTEEVVVKKKLRIKYGTKKFEKEFETTVRSVQNVPLIDDWGHSLATKEKSEIHESGCSNFSDLVGGNYEGSVKPKVLGGMKRRASELVEGPNEKRKKMDRSIAQQCSNVLKKLSTQKSSWPFMQPVDPVKLNIPTYFTLIKHPMDLGTIKSKLDKNKYSSAEKFAADVRLTFSNCMAFNPPSNDFHLMAKKLNAYFTTIWKPIERKHGLESSDFNELKLTIGVKGSDSAVSLSDRSTAHQDTVTLKHTTPSVERDKIRKSNEAELVMSREGCPDRIARPISRKGTNIGDKKSCDIPLTKSPRSSSAVSCALCFSIRCCSCNDLSSEKSSSKFTSVDHHTARKDLESGIKPKCQRSNSGPESDGAGRVLPDESTCHSSNPATDASSEEDWQTHSNEIQLSPKRALRAAMLKSRFAGTILKAQQKKLLDHGDKADALKIQQQKEILERKQREERIRLEAEIKAAEAAAREKAEAERRAQREREREAARMALQKVEKTVEFDENVGVLKEIEKLCGVPITDSIKDEVRLEVVSLAYERVGGFSNPLQELGLFIKDDDYLGEDEDVEDGELSIQVDGEEGEIIT